MFSIINVSIIIKKHYETLLDDAKAIFIILWFFLLPIIISIFFINRHLLLTYESTDALLTAFAVFTGLLLNVIFILFDIVNKNAAGKFSSRKREILLEHLYTNSMYALLISTMNLIILIIMAISGMWMEDGKNGIIILNMAEGYQILVHLVSIFSFVVYFGISHFLMTLMMIFKRLFILLFPSP